MRSISEFVALQRIHLSVIVGMSYPQEYRFAETLILKMIDHIFDAVVLLLEKKCRKISVNSFAFSEFAQ